MNRSEFIKLVSEFNKFKRQRVHAESNNQFDDVELFDNKMNEIMKRLDNAEINFKTVGMGII